MILKNKTNIIYYSILVLLMAGYNAYKTAELASMSEALLNFIQIIVSGFVLISLFIIIYKYKKHRDRSIGIIPTVILDCTAIMLMMAWLYLYSMLLPLENGGEISLQIYSLITCVILFITVVASALYYKKS